MKQINEVLAHKLTELAKTNPQAHFEAVLAIIKENKRLKRALSLIDTASVGQTDGIPKASTQVIQEEINKIKGLL